MCLKSVKSLVLVFTLIFLSALPVMAYDCFEPECKVKRPHVHAFSEPYHCHGYGRVGYYPGSGRSWAGRHVPHYVFYRLPGGDYSENFAYARFLSFMAMAAGLYALIHWSCRKK